MREGIVMGCRRLAAALLAVLWSVNVSAQDAGTNSIVEWNDISMRTTKTGAPALPAMRNTAMVQMAIADALNAISPRHKPYYFKGTVTVGASSVAAIATAAHDVLITLYPAEQARLDADLAASLRTVPDGEAKTAGVGVGGAAARAVLQARSHDRLNDKVPFTVEPADGVWRPTPGDGLAPNGAPRGPDNVPAMAPGWARVVPLMLERGDQFRPGPPPALSSDEHARDFRELLDVGSASSTRRTQDQTDAALFWRPTPDLLLNPVVQHFVVHRKLDAWDAANAFALVNVAMVDAVIACWDAKYAYNQWRPITGIRQAPAGINASVKADPAWTPLLFTPPYPDYPGGHPTASAAAARMMTALFGPRPGPFPVTSGGKMREYQSFDAFAAEVIDARVWGGVHWRSSDVAGARLGQRIADYILERRR
ncbi:MAG: vanadium-dependent haloperoxidase [Burkholderiales bacterium]